MDLISYALSKKPNWDNIKNKPFYDNSWTLDTSNVLKTNDINSGFGFILVSNNPDDFYYDENIEYYCKYDDKEYKLNYELWSIYNCDVFNYNNDEDNKTTAAYVVTQENTSIYVYGGGTKYEISNPSIGVWVKHDPSTNYKASIYTKDVHTIDSKFLPEIEIPQSTMLVIITSNNDRTYSADKTFDEIFEFHNNGGIVEVLFQNIILPLVLTAPNYAIFSLLIPDGGTDISGIFVVISSNIAELKNLVENEVMVQEFEYTTLPPTSYGDENRFLKGDGTWADLPLVFNDAGELEVTLNGVTKTFVAKE